MAQASRSCSRANSVMPVGCGRVCRVCCERGSNGAERPRWRAGRSSRAAAMAERCLRRAELLLLLPMAASKPRELNGHSSPPKIYLASGRFLLAPNARFVNVPKIYLPSKPEQVRTDA